MRDFPLARLRPIPLIAMAALALMARPAQAAPRDATTIGDAAWRPAADLRRRDTAPKLMFAASILTPLAGICLLAGGINLAVSKHDVDKLKAVEPGAPFPSRIYQRARDTRIAGSFLLSLGGAAFVAAATAFGIARQWSAREKPRVSVQPWAGQGAGITVQGRF